MEGMLVATIFDDRDLPSFLDLLNEGLAEVLRKINTLPDTPHQLFISDESGAYQIFLLGGDEDEDS